MAKSLSGARNRRQSRHFQLDRRSSSKNLARRRSRPSGDGLGSKCGGRVHRNADRGTQPVHLRRVRSHARAQPSLHGNVRGREQRQPGERRHQWRFARGTAHASGVRRLFPNTGSQAVAWPQLHSGRREGAWQRSLRGHQLRVLAEAVWAGCRGAGKNYSNPQVVSDHHWRDACEILRRNSW